MKQVARLREQRFKEDEYLNEPSVMMHPLQTDSNCLFFSCRERFFHIKNKLLPDDVVMLNTVRTWPSLKQHLYFSPNLMFEFTVKYITRDVFHYLCGFLTLSDSFDRVTGNTTTETEGGDDM